MTDFEHVELDHDCSKTAFTTSDYAQVVFHNIAETYPTDAHIECCYAVTPLLAPHPKDWVGIFKVGWRSPSEYTHYEWSPLPKETDDGKERDNSVLFPAHSLPKDDGEFYQFCYVTHSDHVRGASTPFQFRDGASDDIVAIENREEDLMVVKTRTALLEEELNQVIIEKDTLVKGQNLLEKERDGLIGALVDLKSKLSKEKKLKDEMKEHVAANDDAMSTLKTEVQQSLSSTRNMQETITDLKKEKEQVEKMLKEKESDLQGVNDAIKILMQEKDELMGRSHSLEQERELYKNEFASSESTLKGYMKEIESVKKQLTNVDQENLRLNDNVEHLHEQLEAAHTKIHSCSTASHTDKLQIEELSEKLRNAEDKLSASEDRKTILQTEITSLQQAYQKVSASYETGELNHHELQVKMQEWKQQKDEEVSALQATISKLELQLTNALRDLAVSCDEARAAESALHEAKTHYEQSQEGALYFLRQAQDQLKERYAKVKEVNSDLRKQLDQLGSQKNTQEHTEIELKREVTDLRLRLQMGQDEYQQKFIECRRLQSEMRKFHRHSSRRSSVVREVMEETSPCSSPGRSTTKEGESQTDKGSTEDRGTEPELVQRSEVATATSSMQDVANLTRHELQQQMADLDQELEARHAKKQKYKGLYQEEKEKNAFLQKHYFSELRKKDDEMLRVKESRDKTRDEIAHRMSILQSTIEDQKTEIVRLREITKRQTHAEPPAVIYPPQNIYPNPYAGYQPVQPALAVVQPCCPPLPLPHPIIHSSPTHSPAPSPRHVVYPQQQLPYPTQGAEPRPEDENGPLYVDCGEALIDSENPKTLEQPLCPLPPPMEPIKLPGAKVAAIKAVNYSGSGSAVAVSPMEESQSGELEQVIVHDLDDQSLDGEEERFLDAPGEPQKICPICNMIFPEDTDEYVIAQHIDTHIGPQCPVCCEQFDVNYPPNRLQDHVQSHFSD